MAQGDADTPAAVPGYVLSGGEWEWQEMGRGKRMREFRNRLCCGGGEVTVVVLDRYRAFVAETHERLPLTANAAREALLFWFLVDLTDPANQRDEVRRLVDRELWEPKMIMLGEDEIAAARTEYAGKWLVCGLTPDVIVGVSGAADWAVDEIELREV